MENEINIINESDTWQLVPRPENEHVIGVKWVYRTNSTLMVPFSHSKQGGCSKVYKGCLPGGRELAVKILKSYKQAVNDFALEVDILSSLKHQNILPLLGVCCENGLLISVYDFFPTGSLEENLHGKVTGGSVLPWETRFKVGVAIAEALNYLHNQYSVPVIHRDIKSSNILLSQDSCPHLSDFGFAIWGPQTSIDEVVGTFGYIAPEYFMHGRVSDRSDIYSFGVVLLELLSGRKPIYHEASKGQESLVMWAKPLLDRGNIEELIKCIEWFWLQPSASTILLKNVQMQTRYYTY
ncbi:pto-interacting protein 1-like [Carica papaya]|uniref:pto-interacting protein 1-like n=1 Tax=Carica papaya TaxID=3649 RepID=UPI000B8CB8F6|nr:pto-interacting protein 1-like [Carica papaya]